MQHLGLLPQPLSPPDSQEPLWLSPSGPSPSSPFPPSESWILWIPSPLSQLLLPQTLPGSRPRPQSSDCFRGKKGGQERPSDEPTGLPRGPHTTLPGRRALKWQPWDLNPHLPGSKVSALCAREENHNGHISLSRSQPLLLRLHPSFTDSSFGYKLCAPLSGNPLHLTLQPSPFCYQNLCLIPFYPSRPLSRRGLISSPHPQLSTQPLPLESPVTQGLTMGPFLVFIFPGPSAAIDTLNR